MEPALNVEWGWKLLLVYRSWDVLPGPQSPRYPLNVIELLVFDAVWGQVRLIDQQLI